MDQLPQPSNDTISLAEAMDRTNFWRQAIKPLFSNQINLVPKGFLIPFLDIQNLVTKFPEAAGVRAYFTLPKPGFTPGEGVSAVLVPVVLMPDGTYKDVLTVPGPEATDSQSSIYDFTKPCPDCCDESSALY